MRRVVVVGTSGSGKTTLARGLAARLGVPHTELDAVHWQPGWTPTPPEEMREKVASVVVNEAWVIDGNYSKVQPLILARADTLIWLDFPLWINMTRLLRRTTRRVLTQEPLWDGCRESLTITFSRDSIFVWAWKGYAKNRAKYTALAASPECANLTFVRLRSPRQAARFLSGVAALVTCPQPANEFPAASGTHR